jgi:hypothetical protein
MSEASKTKLKERRALVRQAIKANLATSSEAMQRAMRLTQELADINEALEAPCSNTTQTEDVCSLAKPIKSTSRP